MNEMNAHYTVFRYNWNQRLSPLERQRNCLSAPLSYSDGMREVVRGHWHSECVFATPLWWTFPSNPLKVLRHPVKCMADLVCAGHRKVTMVMILC